MNANRLEQRCWNYNSVACSYMLEHMLSGNDEITRLNSEVTTTMSLVAVSSLVLHVLAFANNPAVDSPSCNNPKMVNIYYFQVLSRGFDRRLDRIQKIY